MKVQEERLVIDTSVRNSEGAQVDPEEKAARREVLFDVPLLANGAVSGHALQQHGIIQRTGTVAEFAHAVTHECWSCRWFDRASWHKLWADLVKSENPDFRKTVAEIRSKFVDYSGKTPAQVDADIRDSLAICQALTEVYKTVDVSPLPYFVAHHDGGCPAVPGPKGEDLSLLYESRDSDSQQVSVSLYDALMRTAQGRSR